MKAMEEFYDPADMTIAVDAAMSLGELETKIVSDGLRFPLGVAANWSVGDLILQRRFVATSLRFGSVGDNVLGMQWELPSGRQVQVGSRVVKNVAGFDLLRLMVNSRGRLGQPTLAVLRLRPLGERWEGVEARGELDKLAAMQRKVLHSSWAHAVDACLLVVRKEQSFLWTPFNADRAQAGLIQAWLETTAKDLGLEATCRAPKPPKTLDDYKVQIQTLPSHANGMAAWLVRDFGGRALAMGGLGVVEYAPEGPVEGDLKAFLDKSRPEFEEVGGSLYYEGIEVREDGPEGAWEKKLVKAWEKI